MQKLISLLAVLLVLSSQAQTNFGLVDSALIPVPKPHFEPEYNLDKPVDSAAWQNLSDGLHVSFASTNQAYFRKEAPSINQISSFNATCWKGERVSAMLLLWSADSINQIRVSIDNLKSANGNIITANNCKTQLVRYVISNYPYNAKEVTCGEGPTDKAYLMPDRLEAFERFNLPGKTLRPVWISIDVPAAAVAGNYKGTVHVLSEKQRFDLNINIDVQNHVLPKPHDWSFRLDLWQNPWVIAEYYKVKPWSDEHKWLLKKHMQQYADCGGKFITTYAVHSPWSDNSYMLEGGMIEWIKSKSGNWKFDYKIFDEYVQLAMSAGIDKAITIYTPIPWGERFRYLDEATGNYITEQWPAESELFKKNWHLFLSDLKIHLEKKSWFNKTYIGINENEMAQTLAAISMVKSHSPKWKITYAGNWHSELDSLLDDYSCVYGNEPAMNNVAARKKSGKTSTFYICCTPAKPNTFIFSPPVEGRWLGWYTSAFGYDGMLRWAYDAWTADPSRDARHIFWPAGDAFMIYPGGESCIRFEKMREGIVDFEKIKILRKLTPQNQKAKDLLAQLNQHLQKLPGEKEFDTNKIIGDVEEGKKLVDALSEALH